VPSCPWTRTAFPADQSTKPSPLHVRDKARHQDLDASHHVTSCRPCCPQTISNTCRYKLVSVVPSRPSPRSSLLLLLLDHVHNAASPRTAGSTNGDLDTHHGPSAHASHRRQYKIRTQACSHLPHTIMLPVPSSDTLKTERNASASLEPRRTQFLLRLRATEGKVSIAPVPLSSPSLQHRSLLVVLVLKLLLLFLGLPVGDGIVCDRVDSRGQARPRPRDRLHASRSMSAHPGQRRRPAPIRRHLAGQPPPTADSSSW
jgi:hypothetical protein